MEIDVKKRICENCFLLTYVQFRFACKCRIVEFTSGPEQSCKHAITDEDIMIGQREECMKHRLCTIDDCRKCPVSSAFDSNLYGFIAFDSAVEDAPKKSSFWDTACANFAGDPVPKKILKEFQDQSSLRKFLHSNYIAKTLNSQHEAYFITLSERSCELSNRLDAAYRSAGISLKEENTEKPLDANVLDMLSKIISQAATVSALGEIHPAIIGVDLAKQCRNRKNAQGFYNDCIQAAGMAVNCPDGILFCNKKDIKVPAGWSGCEDGFKAISVRSAGVLDHELEVHARKEPDGKECSEKAVQEQNNQLLKVNATLEKENTLLCKELDDTAEKADMLEKANVLLSRSEGVTRIELGSYQSIVSRVKGDLDGKWQLLDAGEKILPSDELLFLDGWVKVDDLGDMMKGAMDGASAPEFNPTVRRKINI